MFTLRLLNSSTHAFVWLDFRSFCLFSTENLFNITVYTADLRLAGTTSQVYINIYGMVYGLEESTSKIHLTNHNMEEFTRGRCVPNRFYNLRRSTTLQTLKFFVLIFRVDSFLLKTKFVGLVERITIEHDNTGILPDWNLDKVLCEFINEVFTSWRNYQFTFLLSKLTFLYLPFHDSNKQTNK